MADWHQDVELFGHQFLIQVSPGLWDREFFVGTVAQANRVGMDHATGTFLDALPGLTFKTKDEAIVEVGKAISKVGAKIIPHREAHPLSEWEKLP